MLDNLRTRSGRFLVGILVVFAVLLLLGFSGVITGDGDSDGSPVISAIRDSVFGRRGTTYNGRSTSKRNAKSPGAADGNNGLEFQDFKTSSTIQGHAFDEAGKPLKDVKISIRRAGGIDILKSATSNDKGEYAIDSLAPDTYDVLANHDKFVPLIRPGYTVQPHEQIVEINFHMPLGADIKGLVSNEEGQPLANVRVAAHKKQSDESRETGQVLIDDTTYRTQITDTPGTFTLTGVAQGPNVFEFTAPGYAMERLSVDVTPEKAAEQMKVTLKRTGKLAGVVVDEAGKPVSTATVTLSRYKPLQGKSEALDKGKFSATTNLKGEFKFEKLFNEGFYDIQVDEPRFAPGIYPLVAVNSDQVICQIGQGGEISGKTQLIDRATTPVAVLVQATAIIKGTTFTQEARSDGAGLFKFQKLPYGTYNLRVDDGKYLSEPKPGVACEREKPAQDVVMELYENARVTGRVLDNETQGSVPYAKVTLQATYGLDQSRHKTFAIKADGHGMFDFWNLPAGVHVAQAEARGFLKGQTAKSQQTFVLAPGERKNDLSLFLDHGGSVEGFVLDADGRSVENVDIQLFPATQFDGPVNSANWKGHTDGTGYFKIWGIEVGERVQLYASASKSGFTKARSDMIELSPKNMNEAIQITMPKGGEVTGIVTDSNKMPIQGAEVHLDSSSFPGDPSPSSIVLHTAPNGTYRLDHVPAGGASIKVSRAGFVSQTKSVTVRNEKTNDNINFELESGQVIAGVVEDLEGYPIAGAKVTATGIEGAAGSETDTTNKKGEFELNNLGKGDFKLVATFKMTTPEGDQSYSFENPRVRSGNVSTSIDCDLGNTTSGKVKGEKGRGVANFTVTLNSKTDTKPPQDFVFNLARGMKDAAGYFRMSKIPRGLYRMTITADGYEPHVEEEVAIGPHRRTVLPEVRLNPAGGVIGQVYSTTSDRPVNNATVRLESVNQLPGEAAKVCAGTTNLRGEFRVATVPEGLYKVSIDHPSYVGLKMEMIHVTEKKQRDLGKLYMEPGGAVRGTVVNNFGDPVPNMQVIVKGVMPAKTATTDAAGNYLIQGVQFGRWPVVVKGSMSGKPMYTFKTSDIERDETERLDFLLEQTSDLGGRLIATGPEAAVNSASVQIHAFDENNVVLDDVHYDAAARSSQYNIHNVPPGQYFLWVAGHSNLGSLSAWKSIFLARGKNTEDVLLGSAKVSGQVVDKTGQPVPNVGVQLLPLFNAPQLTKNLYDKLIKPAVTGIEGGFSFSNVQPGSYQVINQDPAGTGWYAQPLFRLAPGQQLQNLSVILGD